MTARYAGHLVAPGGTRRYNDEAAYVPVPDPTSGHPANLTPVYEIVPGPLPLDADMPGLFRYRDLLPLAPADPPVSLGEGGTPLLPLRSLARRFGVRDLWLKDESRNPTWSYKDRLAAVAVTKARASAADTVVVSTTGNHGAAVAAYAAAAGLRCVALTLHSVPPTMRTLMQVFGAMVVAYDDPADRWTVMREAVAKRGWVPMSSFTQPPAGSNPFGVEGYKTIAYELFQQLGRVPDVVVVPTAYADGLAGIHRGFADLRALGLIERAPRLVAAEVYGPYERALRHGQPLPDPLPMPGSVSFSTAVAYATGQGVAALRESAGVAVPVRSDDEIMSAQRDLAATEGIYLEAASITALLAVRRLLADGTLHPHDEVVVIGTSSGLKDVAATTAALPGPVSASPTLDALDDILATVPHVVGPVEASHDDH
ncbi:threonine synthase [Jiangella gansuensis]|uniref:threonine synthase n=1 Tax=Jiangella gansuensis TaxID=281473 RepID=UPI0004B5B096|nr:pyridoxal-phosphate dependent enzyme [Jiangella gansuensis]